MTNAELKIERERVERLRERFCPNHRTLIEPKHQRLEREMLERSKPVNNTREKELLSRLWSQVTSK